MTEYLQLGPKKIEIQWHQGQDVQNNFPTLIFLHEGLGCTRMWKNFPQELSTKTGCPALVFSRFGYGKSDSSPLPWKINFMHKEDFERIDYTPLPINHWKVSTPKAQGLDPMIVAEAYYNAKKLETTTACWLSKRLFDC